MRARSRLGRALVHLPAVLAVAWSIWFYLQFLPGSLSPDSFDQYEQAITGVFNDHHPPIMALVLRAALLQGQDVGLVIGLQLAIGLASVYYLATTTIGLFHPELSTGRRALAGGLALMAFVAPASPLLFYLVTFWKDTWVLIGMLFLVSALCRWLAGHGAPGGEQSRLPTGSSSSHSNRSALVVVLLASLLAALARHNAAILLVPLSLMLVLTLWHESRRRALAIAIAPLVLYFGINQAILSGFDVERRHLVNATLLVDIVAVCKRSCSPYVAQFTQDNQFPPDFFTEFDERLWSEWRKIYLEDPGALVARRLHVFANMLNLSGGPKEPYFEWRIVDDPLRERIAKPVLERSAAGQKARRWLVTATRGVVRQPLLRPLLGSHAPWLIVSVLGTTLFAARAWRRRAPEPELAVFLFPLAYYVSYLPFWNSGDYRYMFPATILCQIVGVSALIGVPLRKRSSTA